MSKKLDKTVIDLKLPAHVNFTMLYLGARLKISKHVTKSTLISMAIESVCAEIPAPVLFDATSKSYTLAQLRQAGEKVVRDSFAALMDKNDADFYRKMKDFNVPDAPDANNDDEQLRALALQILKDSLLGINLRDTDIENIVSVILISEEDLRCGLEGEDGKGSYIFLKEYEPYAYYKEVRAILFRYRRLQRAEETYMELFILFNKILERIESDTGYTRQKQEDYYEAFDGNMAFLKEFSQGAQSADLIEFLQPEELIELRRKYTAMLTDGGEIESMRNCSNCEVCIFDKRKCVDKWLKRHIIRLLKSLCFMDIFIPIASPTFEASLFSKEHSDMYTFIKN